MSKERKSPPFYPGSTPTYWLYGYVPRNRVGFLDVNPGAFYESLYIAISLSILILPIAFVLLYEFEPFWHISISISYWAKVSFLLNRISGRPKPSDLSMIVPTITGQVHNIGLRKKTRQKILHRKSLSRSHYVAKSRFCTR